MNKQIDQIADQVMDEFNNEFKDWDSGVSIVSDEFFERFAQLIVIECASICYNSSLKDPDAHAQNLMFHFNIDNCRNDK